MRASIFADKHMKIGSIHPNLYGSFIEHLGRAVYEGIYEPWHPLADKDGFRKDVLELIRELGVTVVRYPGGNFVSGYDWRDGIGKERKARLDLAWASIESNEFGTDEFMKWCKKANVAPMLAVNMGTGTPKDALELFEYCNHPSGTYYSDLRRKNASQQPYGVKYWCIGNEMDGEWQICGLDADAYGAKALQTARMLRWADARKADDADALQLVVCGSCHCDMPTYPEWDRKVLEHTYEEANLLSMHRYYQYDTSDKHPLEDFLGSADNMSGFIDAVSAAIRYVKTLKRSKHDVYISFDEWNIWSQKTPRTEPNWIRAPHLLEDVYTLRDAVVFGGLMNTLLNHSDVVRCACLAQLVNVIAPIMTEKGGKALRQTTYYPFRYAAKYGRGETMRAIVECEKFENKHGEANTLNVSVTHDAAQRTVCVFACNYAQSAQDVALELRSFGELTCAEHVCMSGQDLSAANTFASPERVVPQSCECAAVQDGKAEIRLAPLSWNFLRFTY